MMGGFVASVHRGVRDAGWVWHWLALAWRLRRGAK